MIYGYTLPDIGWEVTPAAWKWKSGKEKGCLLRSMRGLVGLVSRVDFIDVHLFGFSNVCLKGLPH